MVDNGDWRFRNYRPGPRLTQTGWIRRTRRRQGSTPGPRHALIFRERLETSHTTFSCLRQSIPDSCLLLIFPCCRTIEAFSPTPAIFAEYLQLPSFSAIARGGVIYLFSYVLYDTPVQIAPLPLYLSLQSSATTSRSTKIPMRSSSTAQCASGSRYSHNGCYHRISRRKSTRPRIAETKDPAIQDWVE